MAAVIAGLLFLTVAITIVINFFSVFLDIFNFFFGDKRNTSWLLKPLKKEYHIFIANNFTFYKRLNYSQKRTFERRLQKFIDKKNFIAKGDLRAITHEMEALIGASAIQITFGLPSIYLDHFRDIYLYPDTYQSQITGRYHKGEVNTSGIIVLSWNNFLSGYLDPDDGRNLGLHEMAHALKIEDYTRNSEFNFLDQSLLLEFVKLTRLEAIAIMDGRDSFFREYAATNDHEFFAVVVENFFERPELFKRNHLRLYQLTTQLLNQDPLKYI